MPRHLNLVSYIALFYVSRNPERGTPGAGGQGNGTPLYNMHLHGSLSHDVHWQVLKCPKEGRTLLLPLITLLAVQAQPSPLLMPASQRHFTGLHGAARSRLRRS